MSVISGDGGLAVACLNTRFSPSVIKSCCVVSRSAASGPVVVSLAAPVAQKGIATRPRRSGRVLDLVARFGPFCCAADPFPRKHEWSPTLLLSFSCRLTLALFHITVLPGYMVIEVINFRRRLPFRLVLVDAAPVYDRMAVRRALVQHEIEHREVALALQGDASLHPPGVPAGRR